MMKFAKTKHLSCVVEQIASVTGSTGDYDIVLDNGETLEEYDETAGSYDTAAPVADDYVTFGLDGGSRSFTAANAQVIKEAVFNIFMTPIGS
jgi:hypothetical protein